MPLRTSDTNAPLVTVHELSPSHYSNQGLPAAQFPAPFFLGDKPYSSIDSVIYTDFAEKSFDIEPSTILIAEHMMLFGLRMAPDADPLQPSTFETAGSMWVSATYDYAIDDLFPFGWCGLASTVNGVSTVQHIRFIPSSFESSNGDSVSWNQRQVFSQFNNQGAEDGFPLVFGVGVIGRAGASNNQNAQLRGNFSVRRAQFPIDTQNVTLG